MSNNTKETKKAIVIRNISLFLLVANLVYFKISFIPPYIWRFSFVAISLYAIAKGGKKISSTEKYILFFILLNLLHFFISYLWHIPNVTTIGNILVALFAFPLFCYIARRGGITQKFTNIAIIILIWACILSYYHLRDIAYATGTISDLATFTNNMTTSFVMILPLIIICKNNLIKFGGLIIFVFFIISGAKRGNIIAAAIPLAIIFYSMIRTYKRNLFKILLSFVAIIILSYYVNKWIVTNDYLMYRIEQTMEGQSSHRDEIYTEAWQLWSTSDNTTNMVIGYGFDGTLNNMSNGHYAHNDWLEILVDYGLIGILSYLLIFFSIIKNIIRTKETDIKLILLACFSIWFLKTLFSMGFTEENLAVLMISMGYAYGHSKTEKATLS